MLKEKLNGFFLVSDRGLRILESYLKTATSISAASDSWIKGG